MKFDKPSFGNGSSSSGGGSSGQGTSSNMTSSKKDTPRLPPAAEYALKAAVKAELAEGEIIVSGGVMTRTVLVLLEPSFCPLPFY